MHEQDLGGHEEVPQHPTRSCERNGDTNENLRGGRGPSGDVFFSEGWGRDGTGGEQGQAVEDGKAADTTASGPGRRRTPAHDGIDRIDGAHRGAAGHGRSHGVNIANPSARCGRESLGPMTRRLRAVSQSTLGQDVAHTTSVLPPQM